MSDRDRTPSEHEQNDDDVEAHGGTGWDMLLAFDRGESLEPQQKSDPGEKSGSSERSGAPRTPGGLGGDGERT